MRQKPRQWRRPVRDTIIITLVSTCLFVPLAEVILRMQCTYCTWTEENQGFYVSPYEVTDKSWYHVRQPNSVSHYEQKEFNYEIKTNSLGFRDIEHPISKPPGEFRILAIGDSFTEGQGAPFERTWLNQLGERLNAETTDKRFRMICGGAAGSDPFFGYRLLMDKLLPYQPDLVLLLVNHSDIIDTILRGGMERFRADGTLQGAEPPNGVTWLYRSSHFARFILFELFDYTHLLMFRSEREERAVQALEQIMDLTLDYQSQLQSRNIEFALVIFPFRGELKRNDYDKLEALKTFALDHQIHVIDAMPYLHQKFVEHGGRLEELYWPVDNHFTELGYRYLSEVIENDLKLVPHVAP